MKRLWVDARGAGKDVITSAIESGAEAVLVGEGRAKDVKALGLVQVAAPDGDLVPGRDFHEIVIASKEDEERAASLAKSGTVIVETGDWTVIPLENLVAAGGKVLAVVRSAEEARLASTVLEKGASGVVARVGTAAEVKAIASALREFGEALKLVELEVARVAQIGMGDRVCVDTCSNMSRGEGMLVGNSSAVLFLVHAETEENPYVEARPFRVNAGAVHAYVQVPGGKTKYLSELRSGDGVLIVAHDGRAREEAVGRAKVERRPMLLVEEKGGGSVILQNAETVRLTRPGGEPVSEVELEPGMKVLGFVEEAGRHFGMKVEETIREK